MIAEYKIPHFLCVILTCLLQIYTLPCVLHVYTPIDKVTTVITHVKYVKVTHLFLQCIDDMYNVYLHKDGLMLGNKHFGVDDTDIIIIDGTMIYPVFS